MSDVKLIDGYAMARRIASDGVKNGDTTIMTLAGFACSYVNDEPEAVVRCKDCKFCEPYDDGGIVCDGVWHDDDWYCADGEKA